ncbi:MAG TPA: polyhydroxyalkanoate synthesis regulator DNA-binding domain-containing protein [Candidatus Dormibacteraeota bacterium]|nr:polyhydroxyalkanoate synthesis regulator DNA-binding domain-containing protein [Candidatus Dormibacteraeota bacterium]
MAGQRYLIKKYANRKLYDTRTSRYITLEGISRLVQQGHDIQVIERDTGRDITSLVLSQIVTTEEKREPAERTGERLQERGQALLDYLRRTLSGPAALVTSTVERGRLDLEELVDLAVDRALNRLSIPTRRDLDALSARIDDLERRLSRAREQVPRRRRAPKTGEGQP